MMWKDLPTPCYVADEKKLNAQRIFAEMENYHEMAGDSYPVLCGR